MKGIAGALRLCLWELRSRPWEHFAQGICIAAASAALVLGILLLSQAGGGYDALHERTGGPHVWLIVPDRFAPGAAARLAADERVAEAAGGVPVLRAQLLDPARPPLEVDLTFDPGPQAAFGRLEIVAGRRAERPGEVALDASLAAERGYRVGQRIALAASGGLRLEAEVVGLAASARHCPFPLCSPPPVWTGDHGVFSGAGQLQALIAARLHQPNPASAAAVLAEAAGGVPGRAGSWWDVRQVHVYLRGATAVFVLGLGAAAGLAAVLITAGAAAALAGARPLEPAIYRSLGMTPGMLAVRAALPGAATGWVAGWAGAALALPAADRLLRPLYAQLGSAASLAADARVGWTAAFVCGVIGAAASLWGSAKARRAPAGLILRTGRAQGPASALGGQAGWAGRSMLPLPLQLGLDSAFGAAGRAAFTVSVLAAGAAAVVFTAALAAAVDRYAADPRARGSLYDVEVEAADPVQRRRIEAWLRDEAQARGFEIEGFQSVLPFAAWLPAAGTAAQGEAVGPGWPDGLQPGPGEAFIGEGLAAALPDAPVLETDVAGRLMSWRIAGTYPEHRLAGRVIVVPLSDLTGEDGVFPPGAEPKRLRIRLAGGGRGAEALAAALAEEWGVRVASSGVEAPGFIQRLRRSLLTVAAFLAGAALGAAGLAAWLAVRDEARILAVYKALGMTPQQIWAISLSAAAARGGLAALLGLPAGLAAARGAARIVAPMVGFAQVRTDLDAAALLWIAGLFVAAGAASAVPAAWSAAAVEPAPLLRHEG